MPRSRAAGFPIRKSTDQRVLAPPRGLSQRATSFIASRRQGIHQMPLTLRLILAIPEPENREQRTEDRNQTAEQDPTCSSIRTSARHHPNSNPATPVARLSTLLHFIPSPAGPMTAPPPNPGDERPPEARQSTTLSTMTINERRETSSENRDQASGIRSDP